MQSTNTDNDNKILINKTWHKRSKLEKIQAKLDKRGKYLPLQTVWKLKDLIKELEHSILINEQQIRLNIMLRNHNKAK